MYRILLLLTLACTFVFPTRAQYVRVNYDKKTVAAMVAAYGTETVAEAYYNEQVKAYNKFVRQFPNNIILGIMGYAPVETQYTDYDAPEDAPSDLFGE